MSVTTLHGYFPREIWTVLTISQSPVFHPRSAMQSFKADSSGPIYYCIWVPFFAPVFHFSSSWAPCFFLPLPKILLKYLFTAQTKTVFKSKACPEQSPAISLFYNLEIPEMRVGWYFVVGWGLSLHSVGVLVYLLVYATSSPHSMTSLT